jgi:hypothetical protein
VVRAPSTVTCQGEAPNGLQHNLCVQAHIFTPTQEGTNYHIKRPAQDVCGDSTSFYERITTSAQQQMRVPVELFDVINTEAIATLAPTGEIVKKWYKPNLNTRTGTKHEFSEKISDVLHSERLIRTRPIVYKLVCCKVGGGAEFLPGRVMKLLLSFMPPQNYLHLHVGYLFSSLLFSSLLFLFSFLLFSSLRCWCWCFGFVLFGLPF